MGTLSALLVDVLDTDYQETNYMNHQILGQEDSFLYKAQWGVITIQE